MCSFIPHLSQTLVCISIKRANDHVRYGQALTRLITLTLHASPLSQALVRVSIHLADDHVGLSLKGCAQTLVDRSEVLAVAAPERTRSTANETRPYDMK